MVKELREVTGAGMMNCKKALTEADGDMKKAVELLREKGLAAAAKKAGRIAAEGLVKTYVSEDAKTASLVEVNCETDFVAANDEFKLLVENASKQAAVTSASNIEEFLNEKYIADESKSLQEAVTALIAKLGENMSVRRFEKFNVEKGAINGYVHGGGKIGVVVELNCEKESEELKNIARELAMQVAAANPLYLDRDSVNTDNLEQEKEIYRVQALNEGKPEKVVEKMVMGRINKYFKENCLTEQVWVKDPDLTIKKYLEAESKKLGAEIKVDRFVRFERGEGIEKKEENFAEEVKKQMSDK
jgi:elongation factor Ts